MVAHVIFPEKQFNLRIGHPPATAPVVTVSDQEGLLLIVVAEANGVGDVDQRHGGRHADFF